MAIWDHDKDNPAADANGPPIPSMLGEAGFCPCNDCFAAWREQQTANKEKTA
jgi:hypothetical protein